MSELYNLIFFPTVKSGESESDVKANLSDRLKVDIAKVDGWFASGKPTLLLKEVAPDVADRYMQAILECGASCNMQPSGGDGKGSLSLMPKPTNVELFVCPQCEHEEELAPGESIEQCPSCDLVLAKWAEKQEEDRKKEEIRRRLLRDARFKDDHVSEESRRKQELAEIKRLEAELMKELGLKPPSKLWQIFSQRPVSISLSVGLLLVTLSSVVSFYVSDFLESEQQARLASEPASEEIQQLAPSMVDAVGLQLTGNQQVVDELAAATQLLSGQGLDKETLIAATQDMMKGSSNDAFIEQTKSAQVLKSSTPGGLGEPAPVYVNRDSIGGVEGLPGLSEISKEQLAETKPGEIENGQEQVAGVLTYKLQLPDPTNPNGADVLVDQIDRLDGSKVVELMQSLSKDLEWDTFLLAQVLAFLRDDRDEQAQELGELIKNPILKAKAQIATIEYLAQRNPDLDFKLPLARLAVALGNIRSPETKTRYWLEVAQILGDANVPDQPQSLFDRVNDIAQDANSSDRAKVLAHLAVANLTNANPERARSLFSQAMNAASQANTMDRIKAFSSIANRYYDARNLTIAGEILSEAQVLAATELKTAQRATALMSIATAQMYQGDSVGAFRTIDNAARGDARIELLSQLAAWLIDEDQIYKAQQVMSLLRGTQAQHRLAIRLIGQVANLHGSRKARALLTEFAPRLGMMTNSTEESLVLSQFARLHLRLRQPDKALQLFNDALSISDGLSGRKADVTRGMIAIDQARGLWVGRANETISKVEDSLILEPLSSQIRAAERTIRNQLPQEIRDQAFASR